MTGLLCFGTSAASAGSVTLPGSPLTVSVGSLGQCQSNYPNVGNNYFPGNGAEGDCGFFLAFPSGTVGQAEKLKGKVYGFDGAAGPGLGGGSEYTAGVQGPVTGSGTSGDPYAEETTYKVMNEGKEFAEITDRTTYVNGDAQFTTKYTVQNVTGKGGTTETASKLFFHAIVAGDLFVSNEDQGTGVFFGGPPKFIGGQNPKIGTIGGFVEATPEWTNFQEGYWNGPFVPSDALTEDHGIWNAVRTAAENATVFNDTFDPALMDNGAGVSWDDHLTSPLEPGQSASYTIVNRSQVPTTLGVQPVNQTLTVGQTASVNVTATDNIGTPYGNRSLVYKIDGANPKSGSVTTDTAGKATISYVGTAAGLDSIQMFLDLNGDGTANNAEPASTAQITWTPAPPTPNSSYKVQSIKANSDGTITIVFVPTQDGTASVEVTVPTATISRNASIAKKRKKCKRNQVRIKGKCRPKTSLSGKATASGKAGVPLTITVKPSSKVKKALAKGRKVQLTAKLTYKSALGGAPTVKVYQFTVKGKKKKKGHRHH